MKEYNNLGEYSVGFALTGSFCVFDRVIPQMEAMAQKGISILPILSETVYNTSTRFYDKDELIERIHQITGRYPIHDIIGAEPIGPQKLCDVIIVAPCTGNTMAKIANGIVDSCVLMAAKAVHRNDGKIVLAISSNDALKTNAVNLGKLLAMKNVYLVPFMQDDYINKPTSLVADMSQIIQTCEHALANKQLQPMIISQ